MADYRAVIAEPRLGGRLITKASQSVVGLSDYVVKRDWRRILDVESRREGHDLMWGNTAKPQGNQSYPNGLTHDEITLVTQVRRPNGQTAIVVGTQTKLWRFYANDSGEYIEDQDGYVAVDYIQDLTGDWILIGSGFSTSGHRWEVVDISGSLFLNNGVDLIQEYRVEWTAVRPLYELREAGISAAGTMGSHDKMLVIGDLLEMQTGTLETQLALVDSGAITASQIGAAYSGTITANVPVSSPNVASSAPFFAAGDVGKTLRFQNGFSAVIAAFIDNQHVNLATVTPDAISVQHFWMTNAAAYVVTASGAMFAATDVGRSIVWDTGEVRTILTYTSPTQVSVDVDFAIPSGPFAMEKTTAYDPVTTFIDRIQFRFAWSIQDEPTRWGPTVPAAMTAGSYSVRLRYPLTSLEVGQEVVVVGAGTSGGNLTAIIVAIQELGRVLRLDTAAETTLADTDGYLTRSDVSGSILGYEDLDQDTSGILRMLTLDQTLIIYKDTSIVLAEFTGVVTAPWAFTYLKIPSDKTLYYRWTLVDIDGDYHLYAGKSAFFRFDLTSRIPRIVEVMELVSDKFFTNVRLELTDDIWAAINTITNEAWFRVPVATQDKILAFDYRYNTMSTSSVNITAAATVKRPTTELQTGETEDWFVMGNAQATILTYGLTDSPQSAWNNAKEIFYRRENNPYSATLGSYQSAIRSGLSDFAAPDREKHVDSVVVHLASQHDSIPLPEPVLTFNMYGAINASDGPTLLGTMQMPKPFTENQVPMFFQQHFFQDEILVEGNSNPVRLSARTWMASGVGPHKSITRRPT